MTPPDSPAPAPHADDEALIDNIRDGLSDDTYNYRGQIRRYDDDLEALSQRLAELRARAEAAEAALAECRDRTIEECAAIARGRAERNALLTQLSHADMLASNIEDRAKAAEAALAECRATVKQLQDLAIWMTGCGFDFAALPYFQQRRHLLTKEPSNG